MTPPVAIDLRCEEVTPTANGREAHVVAVPSCASSRPAGDLERIVSGEDWCCLTYAPGNVSAAMGTLTQMPPGWKGLVRVVPSDWGGETTLLPWLIDDVAAALSRLQRALLVDLDHISPPWQGIFRVAATFPNLAVIVGAGSATEMRIAEALCLTCPNVFLDTSQLDPVELARSVETLGEDRIVFGSDRPRGDPSAALATVKNAGLSVSKTERILWENGERLLSGAR